MFRRLWLKHFTAYMAVLVLVVGAGVGLYSREFAAQVAAEHTERGVFLLDLLATGVHDVLAAQHVGDLAEAAADIGLRSELARVLAGTTSTPSILFAGIYGPDGRPVVESGKLHVAGPFSPADAKGRAGTVTRHAISSRAGSYLLLTRKVYPPASQQVDEAWFLLGDEGERTSGRPAGYLRAGFSTSGAEDRVRQTNLYLAAVGIMLVGLGAGAIYVFIHRMLAPIQMLQAATRVVASGDLDHRVCMASNDEIGSLAASFNEMTERLRASQTQIERHAEQLEQRVAERTAQIRRAYEDLKQAQAQLLQSEKMASIGQLAAGVAHEINNPMGFIQSNLGTLREYAADLTGLLTAYGALEARIPNSENIAAAQALAEVTRRKEDMDLAFVLPDLESLVAESLEGAERVRRIVQNLREFSHMDRSEKRLFSVNQGLESTLNIVWNELKYKATVTKDYGGVPEVEGYPMQMNQVFMNILVNAAQAIRERGTISIRTYEEAGHVCVRISDTGVGMPPEVQGRIFEPFYTTKDVGKGTGLGLNMAYRIVRDHGGDITVESREGAGSTFTVRIPNAEA